MDFSFCLFHICGYNYVSTCSQQIFNHSVTNVSGERNGRRIDFFHARKHQILGNRLIGFDGNDAAVCCASGSGNGAYGVGAFINCILFTAGAGIACDLGDSAVLKSDTQLTANGANDAG